MTYAPDTLKQTCRCGHHKDTHFAETDGRRTTCLGMRCDDCYVYRDGLDARSAHVANKPPVKAQATPSDPYSPFDDATDDEAPAQSPYGVPGFPWYAP